MGPRTSSASTSSVYGVLVVAALLTTAANAGAEERDPPAAEALFTEGRAALERGDLDVACARFQESLRLDPAPGTLLNLAECEERTGKVASAWQHLRRAVDVLEPHDDRVAYARARLGELEPRVPRLTITLAPDAPPTTRVRRGGIELGTGALGVALPLDPGAHDIEVEDGRGSARRYRVTLAPGDAASLLVTPLEATEARTGGARGSRDRLGVGALALGIGGLAVGSVTGLLAFDRAATYRDHCDDSGACDLAGLDAASSGKTLTTASTIAFAVGLVGVGVAAVLVLGGPRATRATPSATGGLRACGFVF